MSAKDAGKPARWLTSDPENVLCNAAFQARREKCVAASFPPGSLSFRCIHNNRSSWYYPRDIIRHLFSLELRTYKNSRELHSIGNTW